LSHLGKNVVICAALIGAGFTLAYLRFRPHLEGAELSDGVSRVDAVASGERLRFARWDAPEARRADFELVGTPTVAPDGRLAVVAVRDETTGRADLFAVVASGEPWRELARLDDLAGLDVLEGLEPLPVLDSPFDEIAPAFGDDGLYFASNRQGGAGGHDLYFAPYRGGRFGAPERLSAAVNGKGDDLDPAPMPDGSGFVFASNSAAPTTVTSGASDFDLFVARRDPAADRGDFRVERLGKLNSPRDEREPCFGPGGRDVVFASNREGSSGFDLYRAFEERGSWQEPVVVAELSSDANERAPRLDALGFALDFLRVGRPGAAEDVTAPTLLRARSIELFRVPSRPVGWLELLIVLGLLATALLAWLAKRWEALDVIYKCFLAALLVHVLLLLWFRRVDVEPQEVALPQREGLFKVQLARALERDGARRERGGSLEVERAVTAEVAAPARSPSAAADATSQDFAGAPRAIELARGAPVASGAVAAPRAAHHATRAEPALVPAVALADHDALPPITTSSAPSLALAAPAARHVAPAERAAGVAVAAPARAMTTAAAPIGREPARAAALPALARSAAPTNDSIAPPRDGSGVDDRTASPTAGLVALELADRETQAAPSGTTAEGPRPLELAPPSRDVVREGADSAAIGPAQLVLDGVSSDSASRAAPSPAALLLPVARDSTAGVAAPGRERAGIEGVLDALERESGGATATALAGLALDTPREAIAAALPQRPSSNLALDVVAIERDERPDSGLEIAAPPRLDLATVATEAAEPRRPVAPLALPRLDPGPPAADVAAAPVRLEHTPYKTRFGLEKELALETHGGSRETERAVALGLRYLASRQRDEGYFGEAETYDDKYGYVAIGRSALCLLAFLGAGHTPGSRTEHSAVTAKAIGFLLSVQTEQGHFGWTSAYSHGIATYALAECYAIEPDAMLRAPLERAIGWIVANQKTSRDPNEDGGFGYFNPDGGHYDRYARVSITAWQVMALESARLGGFTVENQVFDRARRFLENAFDPRLGAFRYSHDRTRLASDYATLPGSTPAALFALSILGSDVSGERFAPAREFVAQRAPSGYRWRGERAFVKQAAGNLYFWYYGSLASFRLGGDAWERWNEQLKSTLLPSQQPDGSWRPIDNYATRAGDSEAERCYSTAMSVLSLEVYYRYFTPLLTVR
jgi:hypothetical protein